MEYEKTIKDINYVIANTFRRATIEIESWTFSQINISVHKSWMDNDMLKNRIRLLPIPLKLKDDDKLSMVLNIENKKDTIQDINISDCKFYLNGKDVDLKYQDDILIWKLKKDQEIMLTANAVKDIGRNHSSHEVVIACCYKEINDKTIKIMFETDGRYTTDDIIDLSCQIIIDKLLKISDIINQDIKTNIIKYEKVFIGYGHTIGNLLQYYLQQNNDIKVCAYKVPHPQRSEMNLYILSKSKPVKGLILNTINDIQNIFKKLPRKMKTSGGQRKSKKKI